MWAGDWASPDGVCALSPAGALLCPVSKALAACWASQACPGVGFGDACPGGVRPARRCVCRCGRVTCSPWWCLSAFLFAPFQRICSHISLDLASLWEQGFISSFTVSLCLSGTPPPLRLGFLCASLGLGRLVADKARMNCLGPSSIAFGRAGLGLPCSRHLPHSLPRSVRSVDCHCAARGALLASLHKNERLATAAEGLPRRPTRRGPLGWA